MGNNLNFPPGEGPTGPSFRSSFGVASQLAYDILYLVEQETAECGWDADRVAVLIDELMEERTYEEGASSGTGGTTE